MLDNIIFMTCAQIIMFWFIDYFDGHGFGVEATIATLNAIVLAVLHNRGKKK